MTQPIHPMLERVARAIAGHVDGDPDEWAWHVGDARAAIQALLEPDEGMLEAGINARMPSVQPASMLEVQRIEVRLRFAAMLLPLIGEGE